MRAQTLSFAIAATLLVAPLAQAQTCAQVEVHHVRPQQGHLMVEAFADAQSYGKKAVVAVRVPAGDAITRLELCGLSPGSIALRVFQDLDSDGKMARNPMGVPTEPWGSSGKPGMFGPTWDATQVALDGSALVVSLSP